MKVSYDTDASASYIQLTGEKVARTVEIDDDVMVDVDAHGEVVGVEFLMPLAEISDDIIGRLEHRFPVLAILAKDPGQWRMAPA